MLNNLLSEHYVDCVSVQAAQEQKATGGPMTNAELIRAAREYIRVVDNARAIGFEIGKALSIRGGSVVVESRGRQFEIRRQYSGDLPLIVSQTEVLQTDVPLSSNCGSGPA